MDIMSDCFNNKLVYSTLIRTSYCMFVYFVDNGREFG